MSNRILEVSNLDLSFTTYGQRTKVLHDLNFHLNAGERVSLIGQSGSGKTVTMRAIIGTLPMPPGKVENGSILYAGRELLTLSKIQRNRLKGSGISIVLQDPLLSFNPVLTIHRQMDDIVRYADMRSGKPRSRSARRSHIIDTLRKVQLSDGHHILGTYPMQLSGGMRQRVLIGMSLLNNPRLLIADEPGTALDVTTQEEVLNLLNTLVYEEGLTLLLITHNLGVVREMADRVYVMEKGRIVEHGTRDEIFASPKHPYTLELMNSVLPLYGDKVKDVADTHHDENVIEIRGVSKKFSRKVGIIRRKTEVNHAVKEVSLDISQGDIFGIAGESGSGKTTLAKILLGLHKPNSGDVNIDGRSLEKFQGTTEFRKTVQIVYQNPGSSLNPRRTVADQLKVPLKFTGFSSEHYGNRINELLDMVELPRSYASMYPHELSGGQKQRVAIARALSAHPKILVLDEPTSALDVLIQNSVINLLHRLRDEFDLTYVFISHDLSLMRNFCNRVAIMFRGEICEQGRTKDIFAKPQHPYTRALLSSIPVITAEEERLKPVVSKAERDAVLVTTTNLAD